MDIPRLNVVSLLPNTANLHARDLELHLDETLDLYVELVDVVEDVLLAGWIVQRPMEFPIQPGESVGEGEGPLLVRAMFDRLDHPASGRGGGRSGANGIVRLASGESFAGKGLQEVPVGDRLILELPGGGGFGDPRDRSPEALARDVKEGYVSPERALSDYGACTDA